MRVDPLSIWLAVMIAIALIAGLAIAPDIKERRACAEAGGEWVSGECRERLN